MALSVPLALHDRSLTARSAVSTGSRNRNPVVPTLSVQAASNVAGWRHRHPFRRAIASWRDSRHGPRQSSAMESTKNGWGSRSMGMVNGTSWNFRPWAPAAPPRKRSDRRRRTGHVGYSFMRNPASKSAILGSGFGTTLGRAAESPVVTGAVKDAGAAAHAAIGACPV